VGNGTENNENNEEENNNGHRASNNLVLFVCDSIGRFFYSGWRAWRGGAYRVGGEEATSELATSGR
jgi:hypothetical protein